MQFQTIIATIALAISATAAPAPNGGSGWGQPGSAAQNQCSQGQVAACCDSSLNVLDLTCTVLILSEIISSQCDQQQVLECCTDPNAVQGGLVDINAQCDPITVL